MDILILDSWLREFLETKATPKQIADYLSLCGPSVEKVEKIKSDYIYHIEVTTNRVDSASVYGIAREASAILPRFGINAKLKRPSADTKTFSFVKDVNYLKALVDPKLCPRFTAVLVKNVKIADSPDYIKNRLESAGVRALNNIVDISNYIMIGLGQPVHTFDYDKIKGAKMILRESRKGEKVKTLDKKEFTLPGEDIVIEDGDGRLIDLAGVMGGDLSAVSENTKNVLLFVQTYDAGKIRKTSMGLAQRTQAATIFEKGTDPELVTPAILEGIKLFQTLCKGNVEKEILNIYPSPYKLRKIETDYGFIDKRMGLNVPKAEISKYLNSLDFETSWRGNVLTSYVPSFRANDVTQSEDIVEEIARIYGYHNLPSKLMSTQLTGRSSSLEFDFEIKVKNCLAGWGGTEVYTLSLVPQEYVSEDALKLKNPLGSEGEYLRTSLMPSLITTAQENLGTFESFHLFEMSNVYLPIKNDLPEERLMLAGIFGGYEYRVAKGTVEALLQSLNIDAEFVQQDAKGFAASKCAIIKVGGSIIGKFGYPENTENVNFIYYEFDVDKVRQCVKAREYKEIPKFPSQIEDLTIVFPDKTKIGEVCNYIVSNVDNSIESIEYIGNFNNSYTFNIKYRSNKETLTNSEVEKIRNKILQKVKEKFGGQVKD